VLRPQSRDAADAPKIVSENNDIFKAHNGHPQDAVRFLPRWMVVLPELEIG
jgi:hypothetical protein